MCYLTGQCLPTIAKCMWLFKEHSLSLLLPSSTAWMITEAEVWPHSSGVKNPKHVIHSSLVIGTSLALPAISGICRAKNNINTFLWAICKLIMNPLKSPALPTQPQISFSMSWADLSFFFRPFVFFFFPSISQILYLDCLEEQLLDTAGTLSKQIQY